MEPNNITTKWIKRNWPFAMTCVILALGIGVLVMRSNEYTQPAAEAAVVNSPTSAVIVPGEATIIAPGNKAKPTLVSENMGRQ